MADDHRVQAAAFDHNAILRRAQPVHEEVQPLLAHLRANGIRRATFSTEPIGMADRR